MEGTGQQQPRTPGHLTPVTSPLPAAPRTPKKSTDSMEHTELLIPPLAQTPVEVSSAVKQEEREIIEHQQSKLPEESSVLAISSAKTASPTTTAVPTSFSSNSFAECVKVETPPPSVIHSTGNVEKITTIQSVTPAVSPSVSVTAPATGSSMETTCSPSVISISTMAATVAPPSTPQPVFSNSSITSPTYLLQDIPNISERIHHSATALKLKTGKGYFFNESTSSMPICTSSVSTSLESPAITAVTPSVISPPASVSPKVTEITPISVASTVPSASPITGSQSITIKAKTQPPIGPSMSQLVTASEMWPVVSTASINKTPVCAVPSTVTTVHTTPSPFPESSIEATGIVQPPPAHVSKLNITPPTLPASDSNKLGSLGANMTIGGAVTSHQSIVASSAPINVASTITNKSTVPSKHSAVQAAACASQPQVPLLPPEISAHFGAFPPHLVSANPQLAAEYMNNAANQQHLSMIQKQQAQQQAASANRTLKSADSRSSPGFVSPAPHFPPADVQAAFTAGSPLLRPPPVSSASGQSPMFVPRPGYTGLSPEMEMLTQQQIFAMYPQLPELRQNGPNVLSRHQLSQIPRNYYSSLPYAGLSQEQAISELAKDSAKLQQLQHHQQQQQSNSGKKDENHHRAVAQQLAEEQHKQQQQHHIVDPPFHLQDPTMAPPIGQRNVNFAGGMRIFPFSMPQPDLMHPLFGMNGQGRSLPVPHNFAGGTSNPTDLSKPGANQTSTTPEPLKRSNTLTKPPVQETAYLPQMHHQITSPSGIPTTYRKDLPTVQEPSAELLRSQMAAMIPTVAGGSSLPLNMSSQLNHRPPSRTSSMVVQPAHPSLNRASESPMAEQALVVNKPPPIDVEPQVSANLSAAVSTPSMKTLQNEQQLQQAQQTALHSGDVQAISSSNESIITRYPILWSGLLALKNDSVSVQMHFVSGNRDISFRALPSFNDNMQPLRITQRMRLDQVQLTALERKIQSNEDFCILLALPCGRDDRDVLTQSENLKRSFINYMQSKQAAGIVNTNDQAVSCQNIF